MKKGKAIEKIDSLIQNNLPMLPLNAARMSIQIFDKITPDENALIEYGKYNSINDFRCDFYKLISRVVDLNKLDG